MKISQERIPKRSSHTSRQTVKSKKAHRVLPHKEQIATEESRSSFTYGREKGIPTFIEAEEA